MAFPSPQDLLAKVQGGATGSLFSAAPAAPPPTPQSLLSTAQKASGNNKSFLGNLIDTGVSFAKKAVSSVVNYAKDTAGTIGDIATGKISYGPSDILNGITGTASGIDSMAKGFNEGVARIIKSTSTAVIGPGATKAVADANIGGVGIGSFSKAITGQDNVATYQDIYDKAHNYALNNNATVPQASTFAGLAVVGSLFADNPLVGPEAAGGKGLFKLSEEGIAKIAGETSEDVIKATLKAENPALTQTELEAIAPVFRETKTPEEVKAAADQITKIQQSPIKAPAATSDVPAPEDVLARSRGEVNVPTGDLAPEKPSYFRALDNADNQTTKFIPVEGQPVHIADNLETFIHQPEHGAYEVLEASTGRQIGKAADTPEGAIKSATEALAGKTPQEIQDRIAQFQKLSPREASLAPPGSPAAARGAELGVPAGAPPKPFNPDLIRSISQEEMPGPVLDKLRVEFPTLSDQALSPIAKRLSKLKRTGDIEGVLQVVRNINDDIARSRAAAGTKSGPIRISKEALDQSIAKVSERKAVGDLPPSIGELMTAQERGRYLDNIQRAIKDPEQAVLAQQEYDALWEHADQRVLDRYEELKIQRDLMRDVLDNSPGRELNDLYKGTFLSPQDYGLDNLIEKRKGKGIDARIEDIMGGVQDKPAAQKMLDDWRGMRDQMAQIEKDIKDIRPKARAARILQTMVEDVPVIARKQAGEIESLANAEDVRTLYKDISGFKAQFRDVYRNFEKVFGPRFAEVKRIILDPFDKSKGDLVDTIKKAGDDLEENIIKKYGFQRGSKESAAIQRYGDTGLMEGERMSLEDLQREFGSEKAHQIVEADGYFRKRYNELIDKVNAVRKEIYPNDPQKIIPKRKDYYRHFTELGDGFREIANLFDTPSGISPELAGLSEWTKPKSKFLGFAQERLGKSTTLDAIGGYLDYVPSYAYAVHIDPHIGNFRYLRRRLADVSPVPGVRELVPAKNAEAAAMGAQDLVKQKGVNNFLEFLDDFANDLAGKTNPADRWLQKVVPGGRKTMKVLDWTNARVKKNTILGNLSSAIAQIFNVPNGIASAKLYSFPGLKRTLASILSPNDAMAASSFIKERYRQDLTSRFKIDWVAHPVRRTTEQTRQFAVWITGALDELGTKFIWNAHYSKAIAEGMADPVKYADDMARKMVAGRGIGEVPLAQKSKIVQIAAPFQLEVANAWYVLGDFVKRKDFGAVATLLVANYLFNRAAEEVRGSPVVWDPIEALIDGSVDAADEMKAGSPGRAAYKFVGRQVGEVLSNVPFGQTVAAAIPDDFVKGQLGFQGGKKELFGSGDPGRFGSGILAVSSITDPLYKLIPPFGGTQIKRTLDGVSSMLQGQVKDAGGNLSFKTDMTPLNVAQAVLFGKNATSQAQDFYAARDDLFQRIYRQDAARTDQGIQAEQIWADTKALIKKGDKETAVKNLAALDAKDPALSDMVKQVAKDEAAGLDGTDRLVKMLGVENGERAKYIADTVGSLKTRDEQIKFLQNLDDKKLISKQVFDQLKVLLPGKIKTK